MSESYLEYLVQKKVGPLRQALKYCLFVATGLSFFVGLLRWPTLLLLGLIMAVVSYFFARNSAVEYEYLILGKELSVDRILGRSKRKKMREFDLARIEILAPAGSHRLDSYKDKKYTTYDFSSGD
ncbi:MAG: hypothetical protein J6P60_03240, partial [Lachnospiraceae bacterium]|nr:hypothetical protein [Lachnospiraceae bacterium]